ncbi:MAG TPA: RIP metalloprotease RseP [Chitinophagaceae bacterium]|nr:RIP metalloprotease RseP [Chitinophagaceae bacterium]
MVLLAIDWAEAGIKAAQFVLSFSIIVILHELGHFFPARWFKCRVEKFYLFFNPWFSLWKKKIGETEWGLGWIPFGGYVKISGMIDESMDKEAMKQPPKSYEFRSKPAWQRLIIMVGGVVVNLILGFLIYAMMLWYWGDKYLPTNNLSWGIATDSLAQSIGLRDGDKIKSIDGQYVDRFQKIPLKVILHGSKTFQVDRNGQQVNVNIPGDFASKLIKHRAVGFVTARIPFVKIEKVVDTSAAYRAGLRPGDKIVSANGQQIQYFHEFLNIVVKNKEKPLSIGVQRGADTLSMNLVVPKKGAIGIQHIPADSIFQYKTTHYSFFEALPAGLAKSWETLEEYWLQLKLIFSGKVNPNESLGSVFSIGKMFPGEWDWHDFWHLTAFFSLVLALMNILPIPALDGGHALFTIIEMITGRKPNEKVVEYAQMVGMILLLGLMAYALGLDIFRFFK